MSQSLREKTVKSLALVGGSQIISRVISFATTIVMARILSPDDYGAMAMATLVIGFISFFNEIGISAAVVQRENITEEELAGCFYISTCFGLLCWILSYFLGFVATDFFEVAILEQILPVLGIGLITASLHAVSMGLMRKELRFKEISALAIATVFIGSVLTVILGILGYGIWSLVIGNVVSQGIKTVCILYLSGWSPKILGGIKAGMHVALYGLNITYTRVLWFIYSSADNAIVGKVVGQGALGHYSMAFTLASLPSSHITGLVVNVSSPVFAKLQSDPEALKNNVLSFIRGVAYISFPALAGLAAVANDLVLVVIGEKWSDTILPFQILCILGFWKSIDPILSQALISTGHATQVARYTTLCSVILPVAIYLGSLSSGIVGAAIAWVTIYPLLNVFLFRLTRISINIQFKEVIAVLVKIFRNTALMYLAVVLCRMVLIEIDISQALVLAVSTLTGVVVYLMLIAFDDVALIDLKGFLGDLGVKKEKLEFWPLRKV